MTTRSVRIRMIREFVTRKHLYVTVEVTDLEAQMAKAAGDDRPVDNDDFIFAATEKADADYSFSKWEEVDTKIVEIDPELDEIVPSLETTPVSAD